MKNSYIRQLCLPAGRAQYKNFKLQIFIIIFCFFATFSATTVSAQELTPAQAASSSSVNYQLPYPGLLPDNRLYFLKAMRDKIMSIFISKPLDKAEFDLLQADKRVHASYMLSKKGEDKIDLAQSTYSKALNYFEDALKNTAEAKSQGVEVSEFSRKLHEANRRHKQILEDITKKQNYKNKNKFLVEHERLRQIAERVNAFMPDQQAN